MQSSNYRDNAKLLNCFFWS